MSRRATRWLQMLPSDSLRISYTLDNDHPAIGLQVALARRSPRTASSRELAPARTYGFLQGRGRDAAERPALSGGSLDNAIVVGKRSGAERHTCGSPTSSSATRSSTWSATSSCSGAPLVGHVVARNGGHALNHQLWSPPSGKRACRPGRPGPPPRRVGHARSAPSPLVARRRYPLASPASAAVAGLPRRLRARGRRYNGSRRGTRVPLSSAPSPCLLLAAPSPARAEIRISNLVRLLQRLRRHRPGGAARAPSPARCTRASTPGCPPMCASTSSSGSTAASGSSA